MKKITQVPQDISTLIAPGKLFIFTKAFCPYCVKAKKKLEHIQAPFEYIEIGSFTPEQIQKLHEMSNHKTYPNIYIGTKPVGGCDDLMKLIAEKGLGKLLDAENIPYDKEALAKAETEKPDEGICNLV